MPPKKKSSSSSKTTKYLPKSSGQRRTRSEADEEDSTKTTKVKKEEVVSSSSSSSDEEVEISHTNNNVHNNNNNNSETQELQFTMTQQQQPPTNTKNDSNIPSTTKNNNKTSSRNQQKNQASTTAASTTTTTFAVPSNKISSQNSEIIPGLITKIPVLVGSVAIPFSSTSLNLNENNNSKTSDMMMVSENNNKRVSTAVNLTRLQHQHRATHEWICFVEEQIFGSNPQLRNSAIHSVEFRMHASFGKQAIELVTKPPFCIKRQGWDDVRVVIIINLRLSSTSSASENETNNTKPSTENNNTNNTQTAAVMIQHTVRLQTPLWHVPQLRLVSHQQQQQLQNSTINTKTNKNNAKQSKSNAQKQLSAHNPSSMLDVEACWPAPQTNIAEVAPEWGFLADPSFPCVNEFLDELVIRCPLKSQIEQFSSTTRTHPDDALKVKKEEQEDEGNQDCSTRSITKKKIENASTKIESSSEEEEESENIFVTSTTKKKKQQNLPIHSATQPLPPPSPEMMMMSASSASHETHNNNSINNNDQQQRDFLLFSSASPFTISDSRFWAAYKDFRNRVKTAITTPRRTDSEQFLFGSMNSNYDSFSQGQQQHEPLLVRGSSALGFVGHGAASNAMTNSKTISAGPDTSGKKKEDGYETSSKRISDNNSNNSGVELLVAAPSLMLSQQGIDSACAALDVVIERALRDLSHSQETLAQAHQDQSAALKKMNEKIEQTTENIKRKHPGAVLVS